MAACARALVAGARGEGAGTRQQRRAAARRFVRRHGRDVGYLAWVLRSVGASSALAAALLGLGAEPARAQQSVWIPLTGAANPLEGHDAGLFSTPALGDLDGDGDLDLVAGTRLGGFAYFENTGGATSPAYAARTGATNPLGAEDVGYFAVPALGDLDGDGDLDLVSGEEEGAFFYFENTGSAESPAFVARTGAADPLDGQDAGRSSAPALGDVDADGDLDLVAGEYDGALLFFENTGSAESPAFVARTGAANPLDGQDVGYYAAPALADLDADGDLDLVVGTVDGVFASLENTRVATSPAFAALQGAANPLANLQVPAFATPAFGDLDGDGDLDMVSGEPSGLFFSFENQAGRMLWRTGADNPFTFYGGYTENASFGDLDLDGDLDIVSGIFGVFNYLENTGSATNPAFIRRTGAANPLDGQDLGFHASAALGDLDADGDLDLFSGTDAGTFAYFENTGSASSPVFIQRTGAASPMNGQDVGSDSMPALGDLDGDGDLDLLAGEFDGVFSYFENTGSAATPAFVARTGAANPLDGQDVGIWSGPGLGDADGDGDLDLVTGARELSSAYVRYFENTGSASSPSFVLRTGAHDPFPFVNLSRTGAALADLDGDGDLDVTARVFLENGILRPAPPFFERTGATNPLAGHDVGARGKPSAGDLDADGDLDLVVGDDAGGLAYLQNTRNANRPVFVAQSGAANPLDGEGVGGRSAPALGDLDADGDLDLVAGDTAGAFSLFVNTGSVEAPALAAQTGAANPLDGASVGGRSAPALGDLDADGDLDLVAGAQSGTFAVFENTGTAESPAFAVLTGAANPLDGQDVGDDAAPALGDVDRDGDLDLVAGTQLGVFAYFENTGDATSPAFAARTGASNPFTGKDVGSDAAPALADLDADGDLDLVSGDADGTFRTFYLPEPAAGWLLGAGAALLGWLARLRRRGRREP